MFPDGLAPMGIVFLTGTWKPTQKVFHVGYSRQKPVCDGFHQGRMTLRDSLFLTEDP